MASLRQAAIQGDDSFHVPRRKAEWKWKQGERGNKSFVWAIQTVQSRKEAHPEGEGAWYWCGQDTFFPGAGGGEGEQEKGDVAYYINFKSLSYEMFQKWLSFCLEEDWTSMRLYYKALSHKDWELPNAWIWLAEMDIDRGLDFPI